MAEQIPLNGTVGGSRSDSVRDLSLLKAALDEDCKRITTRDNFKKPSRKRGICEYT